MKIKITGLVLILTLSIIGVSYSQTVKWEDRMNGDNSVAGLQARGWIVLDEDGGGDLPPWFQGYSASFPAVEGPDTGYVASNFMGANINDLIDQWLISPALNVSSGDTLFFWMRSPTPDTTPFDDSVNVLISYSAGTTPSAFTNLGRFLVPTNAWQKYYVSFASSGTIRFAIRYYIFDAVTYSNYIGLDLFQLFTSSILQSIAVTTPTAGTNWTVGSSNNVTWISSGVTGNVNIKLSTDGGSTYPVTLTSNTLNDGTQNIIVPNNLSTMCRVKVESVNNPSIFGVNPGNFAILTGYPTTFSINKSFGFTNITSSSSYRMIGLPGNIDLPLSIPGNQKTDWNAFYDNGAATNYLIEYDGTTNFNFKPGNGFWLLSKNTISVNVPVVNSVPLAGDNTYSIPLHTGWNIISNPFERSTNWSAVQIANGLAGNAVIHDWNGTWVSPNPTIFSPYKAYYFNNVTALGPLKIPYDPAGSLGKSSSEIYSQVSNENDIKLSLLSNGEEKSKVFVGFKAESTNDFDNEDYFAPPGDFEEARIVIRNSNLSTDYKYLMKETRKEVGEGQIYNLEVKNMTGKELKLSFEGLDKYRGYQVYLVDERLNNTIELSNNFEISIAANIKNNNYRLLIGTQQFIDVNKGSTTPTAFALYQNYPNPFNPTTIIRYSVPKLSNVSIKLYDLLGIEIKSLLNEEKSPGNYELELNANDIASGVYLYKLKAGSFTQSKKMILLR